MESVEIIIKIAAIGLLTAIISEILKQTGKNEIGTMASLAGLIIVIVMILGEITTLFDSVKSIFNFF